MSSLPALLSFSFDAVPLIILLPFSKSRRPCLTSPLDLARPIAFPRVSGPLRNDGGEGVDDRENMYFASLPWVRGTLIIMPLASSPHHPNLSDGYTTAAGQRHDKRTPAAHQRLICDWQTDQMQEQSEQ